MNNSKQELVSNMLAVSSPPINS